MTVAHFTFSASPAPTLLAQASETNSQGQQFEVASVKPAHNGGESRFQLLPNGRFTATNVNVRQLILVAHAIQDYQLIDAPDWTSSEGFDIEASGRLATERDRQQQFMDEIRNLLRDRFKLALRRDTQEQKFFRLALARGGKGLGKNLKATTLDCDAYWAARALGGAYSLSGPHCGLRLRMRGPTLALDLGGMTMKQIAGVLSHNVRRAVLDATGLVGAFDLELEFKPDPLLGLPQLPGTVPDPGFESATLPVALEEQAGLTLKPDQGPVPVWAVVHVERPSPN